MVEPQEVEHKEKKLGCWGCASERGIGIPASSCLCFSVAIVIGNTHTHISTSETHNDLIGSSSPREVTVKPWKLKIDLLRHSVTATKLVNTATFIQDGT